MVPTHGLIAAIIAISWLLGLGNLKKGVYRFFWGQWLLLGAVITLIAGLAWFY